MFVSCEFILLFFPFISVHFMVARQMINEIAFFLAFKVRVGTNNCGIKLTFVEGEKRPVKGREVAV